MRSSCLIFTFIVICSCTRREQPQIICNGLSIIDGQGQPLTPQVTLRIPLRVQATDETGLPVKGLKLIWLANGGGYVENTRTITDGDGMSQVRWTPGEASNQSVVVKIDSDISNILNNCAWDVEFVCY